MQDNCYWRTCYPRKYNQRLRVPAPEELPPSTLLVPTRVSTEPSGFTLGELVAFYGDYRRTTHCDAPGQCYLTPVDIDRIAFDKGNVVDPEKYCPQPVPADAYLRYIGSGVVPPFGTAGNVVADTAGAREWHDAGWWGDEMMRIATVNETHFSTVAVAMYVGLHRLALHYVDLAREDPRYWVQALHHEGHALHYLTDLFAFGHVVTSREVSSTQLIRQHGLLEHPVYARTNGVVGLGGGTRDRSGTVQLAGRLPPVAVVASARDASMESKAVVGVAGIHAHHEEASHTRFNERGARVRNLRGDAFTIRGDGELHLLGTVAREVVYESVRVSLQSLFDAWTALGAGRSLEAVAAPGSDALAALTFLPVFVEADGTAGTDDGVLFLGRWVTYAAAMDSLTGAGAVHTLPRCAMPFVDGRTRWKEQAPDADPCTTFAPPSAP